MIPVVKTKHPGVLPVVHGKKRPFPDQGILLRDKLKISIV